MGRRRAVTRPLVDERDERFAVGPSRIPNAGNGLFARVALKKGDRLTIVGVLVAAESASDLCTRYADHYKYRVGDHLLIPIGYGAMVNHSSTPNMGKVIDGGNVYLEALRDIGEGDELSFSYDPRALERFGLTP